MHIQTQRQPLNTPEQAKARIKNGSPTPAGGEQGGEAMSACGDMQMVNKTLLPQRPMDSGTDMVTQASRRTITKPPHAQMGGWTHMHTDTHTQTQAPGRSTRLKTPIKKDIATHPRTQTHTFRYRETQTYGNRHRDFWINTELTQPD